MSVLEFRGKEMTAEPVNLCLEDVANALWFNRPVVAILEPGDCTRYRLMLIPCTAPGIREYLDDVGIPSHIAHRYIFVVKYNDESGMGFWIRRGVHKSDIPDPNPWTQTLLAWWLNELWRQIDGQ